MHIIKEKLQKQEGNNNMSIKYTEDTQSNLDHINELLESLQVIAADKTIHQLSFSIGKFHAINPNVVFSGNCNAGVYRYGDPQDYEQLKMKVKEYAELFKGDGEEMPEMNIDTRELYLHVLNTLLEAENALRMLKSVVSIRYSTNSSLLDTLKKDRTSWEESRSRHYETL